jgi:signal peptidase I
MTRTYSLRKSRNSLKASYKWFLKKERELGEAKSAAIKQDMEKLDDAIVNQNREEADQLAREIEKFAEKHFRKGIFDYVVEIGFALIFALVIATVVRQMWFELFEIPSGSMRPTFREEDHLTVTKTAFGLNIPLETGHFYFDPQLVQRTGVVIWSGENIPGADEITTYFKVLPYTKRYIKRMVGKPGDSIYFYGGKIYAIDSEGKPIHDFLQGPWMDKIENIPYMYLDGILRKNEIVLSLIKQPIGRFNISEGVSEVNNGKEWVKEDVMAYQNPHDQIKTLSDIWGIGNFAMTKLLSPKEIPESVKKDLGDMGEAKLYLQIEHTPRMPNEHDSLYQMNQYVSIPFNTSYLPLDQKLLDVLMKNMYTVRFTVDHGEYRRFHFENVPDGTYEFYFGKGSTVGWGGVLQDLPPDHPLLSHDPENVWRLFNICMELHPVMNREMRTASFIPHRYAYFRDGDLYVMGAPLLKKDDPLLAKFLQREKDKEEKSQGPNSYIAFRDKGAPLKKDGTYDVDFIRTFGVKIPEKKYLVLGDNHAISADSRVFGYIPEDNLQGAPSLILWPPGERWGFPEQKPYPILNTPRLIVWGTAGVIFVVWYVIHRRNMRRHLIKRK